MLTKPAHALAALLLAFPVAARADAPRAPRLKEGPATSIGGYGRQNPGCAEWTNGCVVCVMANERAQCSTPGIACTPAGVTCKRPAAP